ncbi:MAG: flagellar filament capping protein FliD [Xanthomonadales bacterium]|nr:flagellar filament capping protein FliD [Xanthomonadales bacterium]
MAITSLGAGSGLDLQTLVDQLVAAERQPTLQRLAVKEAGLQAELSAFGSLTSAVDKLRGAMEALKELDPGKSAVVSGAVAALRATASDDAALGSYNLTVGQLAQSNALYRSFTSASDVVGGGTLTFDFGTTVYDPDTDNYTSFTANGSGPVEVEIAADSTVAEVRDQINAAGVGVTAAIISDATGARLVITSDDTGTDNSMEVTVTDLDGLDDDAGLSQLAFNSGNTRLEQAAAGLNAQFTVNGLTVESSRNDGITAIDGLTIDLLTTTAVGETAVLKVANRSSSVTTALNDFASAYNELVDLQAQVASFDPESGQAGILFGDTTLRGLMRNLRSSFSATQSTVPGQISSLVDAGFSVDDGGKLTVDSSRLDSFLDSDFSATVEFLNEVGSDYVDLADQYTGSDGLLQVRTDGIQTRLDDISEQRVDLDERTERLQARLQQRYANLDTLLAGLQSTSQFISAQLANLSVNRNSDS